jgi:type II secretory pathway component PulF
MTEQTRLSEGFHQTNLFPKEMAHVLETGEMTGSMGRALEDARQMGQSQQQVYQAVLVAKAWVWMGLILIIAAAVGIGALYGAYLNGAVKHGLSTGEEETQSAGVPVQSR